MVIELRISDTGSVVLTNLIDAEVLLVALQALTMLYRWLRNRLREAFRCVRIAFAPESTECKSSGEIWRLADVEVLLFLRDGGEKSPILFKDIVKVQFAIT